MAASACSREIRLRFFTTNSHRAKLDGISQLVRQIDKALAKIAKILN